MAIRNRVLSTGRISLAAVLAVLISLSLPGAKAQQPAAIVAQAPAIAGQVPAAGQATPPAQASQGAETLHLLVGRSLVISSPARIKRVSLADPAIAEAVVVSPFQVVLNGKAAGGTTLIIWDENEQAETFEVSVDIDILNLSQKIHEAFPSEPVQIEGAGNTVMLSGKISSADVAAKILEIVKNATPKVTSLMEVPLPLEGDILLEVKFAEVERTSLTQLGVNLLYPGNKMIASTSTGQYSPPSLTSAAATATTGATGIVSSPTLTNPLNIFLYRPDLNLAATIQALQEKNVLQILAEPNLITQSGKEASFLAGGEFPYPILQGAVAGGTTGITIQFKEYGVRLGFTPTLEADGTIHLKVNPEVSALDFTNALTISGFVIPALSTERFASEMDLKDGQSFAMAGLLDNRVTDQLQKVPGLGDIPVLGKLFQSRSLNKSRNELLVLVTPHIVHPTDPGKEQAAPVFPEKFMPVPVPSTAPLPKEN